MEYLMGKPSIEVRANYLGKLPGGDPYYHLLIVVRDGNGNNTYYRGGPDDNVVVTFCKGCRKIREAFVERIRKSKNEDRTKLSYLWIS
jgi:hypothetical protein